MQSIPVLTCSIIESLDRYNEVLSSFRRIILRGAQLTGAVFAGVSSLYPLHLANESSESKGIPNKEYSVIIG